MSGVAVWLKLAGVLGTFGALLVGVYTLASTPGGATNRWGLRGRQRVRAMQQNSLFARFEPLIRWLGAQLSPLLGPKLRRSLDLSLTRGGDFLGLLPEEFVALSLLSSVGGLLAGASYAAALGKGGLYSVVGAGLGLIAPYLQLSHVQQERSRRIQNGLPYVIDLLALGLSAGLDLPGSLRQVIEKSSSPGDPLIEELHVVLQELEVGKTRKVALQQLAERAPGEAVREFVGAVIQAEERGNPLGRVLSIQADVSRQQRSVRAEEAAAKAATKMLGPMVLLFCAVLLLIAAPMVFELQVHFGAER